MKSIQISTKIKLIKTAIKNANTWFVVIEDAKNEIANIHTDRNINHKIWETKIHESIFQSPARLILKIIVEEINNKK